MTLPRRMTPGDVASSVASTPSVWETMRERWRVAPIAATPWDGTLRRREYALMLAGLGVLPWLLPPVTAVILLGSALAVYAIGTSSWSHQQRLVAVLAIISGVVYAKVAYPRPHVGWVRQGIEAFFILRGIDFALSHSTNARGLASAASLARFFLWIFFPPTLFLGPMASYVDFYRSYQPSRINRRQLLLPTLAKMAWGGFKLVVLGRAMRALRSALVATAVSGVAASSLALPADLAPRWLIWGTLGLDLVLFYLTFSGFIDIVLGLSRLLGLHLPENFDKPLLSTSLVRYWKTSNISVYRWLMAQVFWRYWDHSRLTAKVVTTFLVSGVWHLMLLRSPRWDAALQIALAFASFGCVVAVGMHLSRTRVVAHLRYTGHHPWARGAISAVKMVLTFSTVALIHQLFWNGLHGRPLADTLETYRRLMFGVQ